MPDDNEQTAKISRQIGYDEVRACKAILAIDKIADNCRNAPFQGIASKGKQAYLPAKFSAHIHRAGVTAADFRYIFISFFGDNPRKVKATDKIANDCHDEKLPPVLRKIKIFHNSPFATFGCILLAQSFAGNLLSVKRRSCEQDKEGEAFSQGVY